VNAAATTPRPGIVKDKRYKPLLTEAKADLLGLDMLQYMFDKKLLPRQSIKVHQLFWLSSFGRCGWA